MRSAGYKAVKSYLYGVKDRPTRAGYLWPRACHDASDAKRMADTALGKAGVEAFVVEAWIDAKKV